MTDPTPFPPPGHPSGHPAGMPAPSFPGSAPSNPGRVPRPRGAVIADVVIGVLAWVGLALVGVVALLYSLFFGMAGDACYSAEQCPHQDLIGTGMFTVWAGVALAGLLALAGTVVCASLRRYFCYWPLIGIGIVIAAGWIGTEMANRGGGLT